MALTRKMLKAMGIEDEQIDQIVEAHSETVSALKDQIEQYKGDAEKLPALQTELAEAKAAAEKSGKDPFKVKYEALKDEFDSYKAEQIAKETRAAKETAYRALLKEIGVSDKRLDSVLKVSDVDGVELDDKGEIKNAKELTESIKAEWSDFIVKTDKTGADTPTPPENGGAGMTKDEIFKIKDPVARQDAIAKNLTLFGKDE